MTIILINRLINMKLKLFLPNLKRMNKIYNHLYLSKILNFNSNNNNLDNNNNNNNNNNHNINHKNRKTLSCKNFYCDLLISILKC